MVRDVLRGGEIEKLNDHHFNRIRTQLSMYGITYPDKFGVV